MDTPVIESPQVSAPVESSPIERYIPQIENTTFTVVAPTQSPTPEAPAPVAPAPVAQTPAAPAAPTEADKVRTLGTSLGLDLSRFQDEASARAAVTLLAEQFAQAGGAPAPAEPEDISTFLWQTEAAPVQPAAQWAPQTQWQAPQQAAPVVPAAPAPVPAGIPTLDPNTVDPSIAAVVDAQNNRIAQLESVLQSVSAGQQASQVAQLGAVRAEIGRRAASVVDALNSPTYGTSAARSAEQKAAAARVIKRAGNIINGMQAQGHPLPVIETVMQWALAAEGAQAPAATPQAPVVTPQAPAFSLPPSNASTPGIPSGGRLPRVSANNDPFGLFKDPQVRSLFQDVLSR